jgi:hypothetical protein
MYLLLTPPTTKRETFYYEVGEICAIVVASPFKDLSQNNPMRLSVL